MRLKKCGKQSERSRCSGTEAEKRQKHFVTAGFKLAWGMAKELEADGLYSFEREEEEHICHPAEQED